MRTGHLPDWSSPDDPARVLAAVGRLNPSYTNFLGCICIVDMGHWCIIVYFQSGAGVIHILIFDLPLTWSPYLHISIYMPPPLTERKSVTGTFRSVPDLNLYS